jgi:dihydroorotate dehydrogenase
MSILIKIAQTLPPETAHNLSLRFLRAGLAGADKSKDDPILALRAFNRNLVNPIGLAAGFDKNAIALNALGKLGFGFLEAGTVTLRPQSGNPRPRLFRLPADQAVINRMGFNNAGVEPFVKNLRRTDRRKIPAGANIGINKEGAEPDRDYSKLVTAIAPYADYITINVSSPNTPGLRDLQGEAQLTAILSSIATNKPVFVKIAPDLGEGGLEALIAVCMAQEVAGLIISNTTTARPETLRSGNRTQAGGLSGKPLMDPSTALLKRAYRLAGRDLMLIGAGGIFSAADALDKILAGATLVQLYTGFAYQGPALIPRLKKGLAASLAQRGFKNVTEAIGAGV